MPVFKIDGTGSTVNSKTGRTFRYSRNTPIFISDSDLEGLKHIRPRLIEVRPTMVPVEPILPTESLSQKTVSDKNLSDLTQKRGAGRPRKQ